MEGTWNLKSLTMDELAVVIKTWPWFGAARRELCERMSKMGGSEWGKQQYADAALYIASRTIISDIVRSARETNYSDKDVQDLLKKFIAPESPTGGQSGAAATLKPYRRTVTVPGGDFFSQEDYKDVTLEEDNYFSKFKAAKSDDDDPRKWEDPELGFCTETLAWVYADQGYYAEAKKIYSRLMLRYPEKFAYFASLIEKLDEEIKK